MKMVTALIKDGTVSFDFNGFPGNTCQNEENILRTLLAKAGVSTDVEDSDSQREAQIEGVAEREIAQN